MRFAYLIFAWLMLAPIALAQVNSTIQCYDANTLEENVTVYMGANSTTLQTYTRCQTGCDNTTFSCSPTQQNQALTFFVYFIGFILIVVIVMKVLRVF